MSERGPESVPLIIPVILCGGAGTRLWPASHQDEPKPFLPLVDGVSTFAMTLARLADTTVFGPAIVVASAAHRSLVDAALAMANTKATLLLEPAPRDTSAAIACAASFVVGVAPDAMLLVLPADHVIRDTAGFSSTVMSALPAAESGRSVVFGIKPNEASTAFGYIRPGARLTGMAARAVDAFVEKPDTARAATFVASGYLWNSGIFLMGATTAVAELAQYVPQIAAAGRDAVARATADGNAISLASGPFLASPKQSIDYAVMEKTKLAAVVEAKFDWSDLGTWSAVWEAGEKDANDNVISGDAFVLDAKGTFVSTDRDKIGVVGIDNVVVVAGDGAVLITSRDRSGSVKDLVAAMEAAPEALIGDFVRHHRPWGYYQSLDVGTRHQVKRIVVNPGARLSLQKHSHRAEHWTVVEGIADITVGMERDSLETKAVSQGEHVYIPLGAIHRMGNSGKAPMTLIEVQVGDYLGEDDIVRLEDDYGR